MDVLDEARGLVENRLGELDNERERLQSALKELGGKPAKKKPGRPRKTTPAATNAKPRRRRSSGKTRADEAVKLINGKPGISASDIAKTMKIKPNYLYRVLGDLEKEGRVKKDGRQYYPAENGK